MVPEDGESAPKGTPGVRPPNVVPPLDPPRSSDPAAFDATIAPTTEPDVRATKAASQDRRPVRDELASGETMAAPAGGDGSTLSVVPTANYLHGKEIARGGMGRIIAAEDRRLGRPVALKEVLEPVPEQIGRFQREALITARLQHPGIVPVYEAGSWPSGEPFFAMKLVSGRPLDRVIADAKTLEERLALLPRIAAAADAMAYAHSQRVIHRDLKPGNVLIGDFGETVVIDWGLAKDLDAADSAESNVRQPHVSRKSAPAMTSGASTLTVAGAVMGTPAYMAPEQARGETVDQRADVFALGAMLYHLLAGVPPYNARTATDVIAAAALGKVVPLTERERRAPHDLVAIVVRAMSPDVSDRYQNAGELAEELRRFLTGQLVGAHEYSAIDKVVRFVKRHRAAVAISVLATIGFAVGGTLAVREVVRERDRAEQSKQIAITRQNAAEHLVEYMQRDVKQMLQTIGRIDLLAGLGTSIRGYYDTLSRTEGGMGPDDVERMAAAIDMLGDAEMRSGKLDRAYQTWNVARNQLAGVVADDRTTATFRRRRLIAKLDAQLGWVHQQRGKLELATETYTKAKEQYDALKLESPGDREVLLGAAAIYDHLGDVLRTEGKIDRAFDAYASARADREKANSQGGGKTSEELLALSTSHMKLGTVYQARGESALALEAYRAAVRLRDTLYEADPDNVENQEKVLEAQTTLAEIERLIGDDKNAIATYRDAVPVMDNLFRRDPTNAVWKRQRGLLYADLGFALLEGGDFKDSFVHLETALEIERELADRDPTNSPYQVELSRTYTRLGDGHLALGGLDDALAKFYLALEIRKRLAKKDQKSVPYRRSLGWSYHKLAAAFVLKGDAPRALETYALVHEIRTKLAAEATGAGGFKNELASTEINYGRQLIPRDPKRSAELIATGLKRARNLVDADAINNEWKETTTQGLLAQAELAKANADPAAREAALTEARGIAETATQRTQSVRWPAYLAEAHAGLAELATARGDAKAASAAWKQVRDLLEPMAKANRLAWVRKPLLERALAQR